MKNGVVPGIARSLRNRAQSLREAASKKRTVVKKKSQQEELNECGARPRDTGKAAHPATETSDRTPWDGLVQGKLKARGAARRRRKKVGEAAALLPNIERVRLSVSVPKCQLLEHSRKENQRSLVGSVKFACAHSEQWLRCTYTGVRNFKLSVIISVFLQLLELTSERPAGSPCPGASSSPLSGALEHPRAPCLCGPDMTVHWLRAVEPPVSPGLLSTDLSSLQLRIPIAITDPPPGRQRHQAKPSLLFLTTLNWRGEHQRGCETTYPLCLAAVSHERPDESTRCQSPPHFPLLRCPLSAAGESCQTGSTGTCCIRSSCTACFVGPLR